MVSSGQVTGDLNSLLTNLTSYTSHMGDLASSWKGPSYDNLSSKAEEFTNDYKSVISDGMNAFASACSTYVTFVATKQAYNDAVAKANAATDPDEKARWAAEAERLKAEMEKLRTEIRVIDMFSFIQDGIARGEFGTLDGLHYNYHTCRAIVEHLLQVLEEEYAAGRMEFHYTGSLG